jgi:hypothetical protein
MHIFAVTLEALVGGEWSGNFACQNVGAETCRQAIDYAEEGARETYKADEAVRDLRAEEVEKLCTLS